MTPRTCDDGEMKTRTCDDGEYSWLLWLLSWLWCDDGGDCCDDGEDCYGDGEISPAYEISAAYDDGEMKTRTCDDGEYSWLLWLLSWLWCDDGEDCCDDGEDCYGDGEISPAYDD